MSNVNSMFNSVFIFGALFFDSNPTQGATHQYNNS